ncbi:MULTISPECIES: 30S ribosome-binding factor RbfA [Shuttleworthella]|uniref:Ribosome-binding factor A n=1 Tax=Shuttleworthella satelles DSM 14600 TaxID=626523 RepID=C4GBF6_9FIRM|nr:MULTISPECIES: 30S ribosome-binding factor RbfA [Shuttleworthia]EEP28449.1 ribosome-binding factor A [Shuttleworthia satelles DSM 14600]EUB17274.1 ribosome-binding factor A [Shuttleworthia sp. MSX8B]
MRKRSVKNNRINEEVLRELSKIIREDVKDPRVSLMTSVTLVEVAPDLKTAKVYVSVLGDKEAGINTVKGLKSSAGFIRGKLAHSVNLRNTPELFFILDDSIAYGVRMSKLIDQVNEEDAKHHEKD